MVSENVYRQFIVDANQFGVQLYQRVSRPDENVFYSPVGVAAVLGIAYAGAKGETARQIATTLTPSLADSTFHPAANRLALDLASRQVEVTRTADGEKRVELSLVRSIWAQEGYAFSSSYLDTLSLHYDVGVRVVDFRKDPSLAVDAVNAWASRQTCGRIKHLSEKESFGPSTRLFLVSTVYLRASWEQTFDPRMTHPGDFHLSSEKTVQVPMMRMERSARYTQGDGFQALELPYFGRQLSMLIVVPETGRFADVRNRLDARWLAEVCAGLRLDEVAIAIPKFAITSGAKSFKEALHMMGVRDAFSKEADFSGIEPRRDLIVSDVVQQTFLEVAELGTEAAATTGAQMAVSGAERPSQRVFTADRPFFAFIRDISTGTLLFIGQVVAPLGT